MIRRTILAVMVLTVIGMIACCAFDGARDTVSFTLTFADRPIPDVRSYEALWLTGDGFKRENDLRHGGIAYGWFAIPVQSAGLSWKLTYDGYADVLCHGAARRPGRPGQTADTLANMATELCRADEAYWRDRRDKYHYESSTSFWAFSHLVRVIGGYEPNGAPHPWDLPPETTEDGCPVIIRDALFYDLTARFGLPEARRRVVEVSSEYDRGTRFCLGYLVPTLGFEKEATAFRQVYRDGVGGETIAELQVKYPGRFFGGGFHPNRAESYFKPAVLTFVLEELQKPENRGKTICGTYTHRIVSRTETDADGIRRPAYSADERLRVEGRPDEDRSSEGNIAFDGTNIPSRAYADRCERNFLRTELQPGVKTIGALAFANCGMAGYKEGLVRLPDGLESIGEGAFRGCNLTDIEIPDSVTNIGAWAFCECHSLKSVRLSKNLSEIADGLFCRTRFEWYKDLERIEIPSGVRRIGKYAFSGCVGLKEVMIPDSVEEVDDYAFYGCAALKRPTFAPSVKLGRHVFAEK